MKTREICNTSRRSGILKVKAKVITCIQQHSYILQQFPNKPEKQSNKSIEETRVCPTIGIEIKVLSSTPVWSKVTSENLLLLSHP